MNSTKSIDIGSSTCYHSTLQLLGAREQAPPRFWDHKEVLEVPSFRSSLAGRRTFSCCSSLQVRLDREARAVRERGKKRTEKHQDVAWWGEYGMLLNRTIEELDDVQHALQLAARLHNTVMVKQGCLDADSGLDELDPIWIDFEGQQSLGGRVVNMVILREELGVALMRVTPYQ